MIGGNTLSELNEAMEYAFHNVKVDRKNSWQLGKICQICNDVFDITDVRDPRMVCPECLRRLKNLLYPEGEQ